MKVFWRSVFTSSLAVGLVMGGVTAPVGIAQAAESAQTGQPTPTTTGGQPTQTVVPLPNCNVDPNQTIDPTAVAAAQKAIAAYLAEVNRTYSRDGFATAAAKIAEGNGQTDWYLRTVPLACGKLVGGFQGMNWVPGRGWQFAK